LARSGDPLAIIAARMRLLLSGKQDLLRMVEETIREFGLGKPGRTPAPSLGDVTPLKLLQMQG
jgi:hypothetical protein